MLLSVCKKTTSHRHFRSRPNCCFGKEGRLDTEKRKHFMYNFVKVHSYGIEKQSFNFLSQQRGFNILKFINRHNKKCSPLGSICSSAGMSCLLLIVHKAGDYEVQSNIFKATPQPLL